jgi:arylsulfatase
MNTRALAQGNLTRRDFLKCTALASALPAVTPAILGAAGEPRKPNLLFLWTDEQRADTMAVYGNQKIQTPNLNKLAAESVVFERAYVSQPVCTPARSTVMTGLWPHQSGLTKNNIALPPEVPTLPEIANDPDYRTGYFGKWHLGDEIFAQHGFEEWRSMESYSQFYGPDRDLSARSSYHQFLLDRGYTPDTDDGQFSRGFAARLPIEHCKPKYLEGEACDFLQRHQNEPFMLYVNFLEPHMPFYGPLDGLYDPAEVDLPANFNDPLEENEPEAYRKAREEWLAEKYNGEYDLNNESDWRRLIAKYWGLVTQVDRSVGAILDTLERLGLADNTIVVYTSDHGDMMGSHRLLHKTLMYEESMRVPWLMRVPELGRTQRIVPSAASHIDLVPTLIDFMGITTERPLPGKSLRPRIEGRAGADPVFVQWNPGGGMAEGRNPHGKLRKENAQPGNASRTVLSPDGWKLTLHTHDRGQLYDLNQDPGETKNLFDVPEHRAMVERLAEQIQAWQASVGDSVVVKI